MHLYRFIKNWVIRQIILIGNLRSGNNVLRNCSMCRLPYIFDHTNVSEYAIKNNLVVYVCDKCDDKHRHSILGNNLK